MKIFSKQCPKCNGTIEFDENTLHGTCKYCNTPFVVDKESGEIRATVILSKNTINLLKRLFQFIEDGDFDSAKEKIDIVLEEEPENAAAWLAMLMTELRVRKKEDLGKLSSSFENKTSYNRAIKFASPELRNELLGYVNLIKERNDKIDILASTIANLKSIVDQDTSTFESILDEIGELFVDWTSNKNDPDYDKKQFIVSVSEKMGRFLSLVSENDSNNIQIIEKENELAALRSEIIQNGIKRFLSITQISDGFGKWNDKPIEWTLLWQNGKKALFITKNCVHLGVYNEPSANGNDWFNCSLRRFLNGDFFYSAFSDDERRLFITNEIGCSDGTAADNVFILSCDEVAKYMISNSERIAKGTLQAIEKGLFVTSDNRSCWWLRNNNKFSKNAPIVDIRGEIDGDGIDADTEDCGIRPAIWIELK